MGNLLLREGSVVAGGVYCCEAVFCCKWSIVVGGICYCWGVSIIAWGVYFFFGGGGAIVTGCIGSILLFFLL